VCRSELKESKSRTQTRSKEKKEEIAVSLADSHLAISTRSTIDLRRADSSTVCISLH
jgi:hypothetical protein